MNIFKTQWPRFQVIATLGKQVALQKRLLAEFAKDPMFRKVLRILTKNVLRKNVPVSAAQCKKLKKNRSLLLDINKRNNSAATKQKLALRAGPAIALLVPLTENAVKQYT